MRARLALALAAALAACAHAGSRPSTAEEAEVAKVLDDWHAAAARADEQGYFALMADGAVFLGTDMGERWEREAFRAFAHPHFAKGKAWSFRAVERHLTVDPGGEVAWFDERLDTPNLGPARGSGVLRRGGDGAWRIAHYHLAVPIPNERFAQVKALIEGSAR